MGLNCHLIPDFLYKNLVGDPGRGVVLVAELCSLPALIWPFSSWPGTSWLIPSCLEFHLFWVLARSSGSWHCSAEAVLAKFSLHDARVLLNTRVNWNPSWMRHFSSSFCKPVPELPKEPKSKCPIKGQRWVGGCFGTTWCVIVKGTLYV